MPKTLFHHPLLGEITLSRSVRARRISVRVSRMGEVTLVSPVRADVGDALAFLESKVDWVRRCVGKALLRTEVENPYSREEMADMVRRAEAIFPERVRYLADRFGFRYGGVRISVAYSKWGSCSPSNVIMISALAVTLPRHLQDFLVLHELCHTVHHDHSPRFHATLDACCGGREGELSRELRRYHTRRCSD